MVFACCCNFQLSGEMWTHMETTHYTTVLATLISVALGGAGYANISGTPYDYHCYADSYEHAITVICIPVTFVMCNTESDGIAVDSVVRVYDHGAMGCQINPSWWTNWAIFRSSQCSTTGVTKAVVCAILYVLSCLWDCAYKRTLAANQKE